MCFHCEMLNIYLKAAKCRTHYTRYFSTWFIPTTFVSGFTGGKRPQHFFSNLTCVSGIIVCFSERKGKFTLQSFALFNKDKFSSFFLPGGKIKN